MKRMDADLQGFDSGTIGFGDGLFLAWTWLCTWRYLVIGKLVSNVLALPFGHLERVLWGSKGRGI